MSSSASIALDIERDESANAAKLRDLDAFEEFCWRLEQSVRVFHVVIAELNGRTVIEQWQKALDVVQSRYPLLSASIRRFPGKRPFFEKVPGVSMPVRIAPLMDSLVPEEGDGKRVPETFWRWKRPTYTGHTLSRPRSFRRYVCDAP